MLSVAPLIPHLASRINYNFVLRLYQPQLASAAMKLSSSVSPCAELALGSASELVNAIRACSDADLPVIFDIINESACAYKGVIPADRWHEPYMPMSELESEIAKGVRFYGCDSQDGMVGVMGIQDVKDVTLIRHAYVRPECRRHGVGRALLEYMTHLTARPILIGTWRAADWAVRFYQKNGFALIEDEAEKDLLLRTYWTIPDRQVATSVVLTSANWPRSLAAVNPKQS